MRCADFIAPGKVAFRGDAAKPKPAPGEVLVRVASCGICGSDLHMFRNNSYRSQLVRATVEGYDIPGHEFAGTIAAIGEGVVGVTGQGGGKSDYVTVPVNPFQLVRIPEGARDDEAATTEPLADALQMVRKAAIQPGENILIFDVGIIGLGVIQAIRYKLPEAGKIFAVDVHAAHLAKALEVGATHGIDAKAGDVFVQVAAIAGTETGYQGTSTRIAVDFDCAGYLKHMKSPLPLETALRLIDLNGGRIVCFGDYEGAMTIDMGPMIEKQPVFMGASGYAAEELVEALTMMRDCKVDRATLISHRFPIEQVEPAFQVQSSPNAAKVMLVLS